MILESASNFLNKETKRTKKSQVTGGRCLQETISHKTHTVTHAHTLYSSVSLSLVLNAFLLFIYWTSLKLHSARSLYNKTSVLSAKIISWACDREQSRDATDRLKLTSAVDCRHFICVASFKHRGKKCSSIKKKKIK